ncbi:uncharacterized protein [Drosophila kikkawai]|uniref:Uncharacterized protein n=1 Tax=Drosophila kikkawai TaxID=30033 RepID=A0A6P4IIA8_DROKI|nr:uncharacterized protein LOC108078635 [Drosophila kikkawai]
MSFSPGGDVSDNEDSDSFHSFNDSEISNQRALSASWKSSLGSDCDSAAGMSEHETSGSLEDGLSIEQQPQTTKETPPKALFGKPDPKSGDQKSECSSDSSACDGVSTNGGAQPQTERFKTLKKFVVSPLNDIEEPLPMCLRKVPKLASKKVPNEELFDMEPPQLRLKDYLESDPRSEAKHKHAFTEIWVGSQQKCNDLKRSPLREFSTALDAYFTQDLDEMTTPKEHDDPVVQPVMKPAKTIKKTPVASVKPAEEYVSPFENMPVPAGPPKETSLLDGAKKPVIVPAGFDLTRLVEFKNPNHWARRQHVRTGDRVF